MLTQALTVKESLSRLVATFPENISWDEVQYRLYLQQMIEDSEQQINSGNSYTQEEAEQKLAKWFK
ncbi:MAG: hypothetical protein ACRC10_06170 [Thermoguttaceae bacterium]